ncbi:MAG: FAD-dependent oxidoreductase [Pseudomonadota bacterium]
MKAPNKVKTDLCIIGAGSGGLSVAAGAAQMGAQVTLLEKGEMGGDCLNYGCVPSKAILAAGKAAKAQRSGAAFGVAPVEPQVDFAAVNAHVKGVIAAIAPHDSQERFEGLGVNVIRQPGAFISDRLVAAGDTIIEAKRFIVATGSRAAIPPIPGLEDAPYLTNESIFEQTTRPEKLIVIGAGPIGLEMAQAHRRLGSEVVVLERDRALAEDDPDLAAVAVEKIRAEGVEIREGAAIAGVRQMGADVVVDFEGGESLSATHILVAAGRRPNVEGLGLEKAGIAYSPRGVAVDARLRSSNKRVFAIGDVATGPGAGLQFTHMAGYHAGIVIRNALFRVPAKASVKHIPWATYTDPELAQVGLTEAQAKAAHGDGVQVIHWSFKENDRAQAELRTEGLLKAVLDKRGRILGCGIVGPQAGELIQIWALALSKNMHIKDLTGMVAPYPTLGEVSKRAAGQFYAPKLFSERTRWAVRQLLKLG